MKPFRAARGGDVVARLEPAEAGVVGLLLDQLEQLLEAERRRAATTRSSRGCCPTGTAPTPRSPPTTGS